MTSSSRGMTGSAHLPTRLTRTSMAAMTTDDTLAAVKRYASDSRLLTRERDRSIVVARAQGATLRQIGDAAGLTAQGVRKIVARMLDNSVHTVDT